MCPLVVVVLDELVDSSEKFIHCISRIYVYVFLLDSAPETFYPNVVFAASSSVHAYLYAIRQQFLPFLRSILRALVRVNNLRSPPHSYAVLYQFLAVVGRKRVAQPPANYKATVHVYDGI